MLLILKKTFFKAGGISLFSFYNQGKIKAGNNQVIYGVLAIHTIFAEGYIDKTQD